MYSLQSSPIGQTLIQRPHGEIYRLYSASNRVAQVFLSVSPSGYSLPSRAFTGQISTHCMQCVHKDRSITGSGGISAAVKIEANRTLGPNFSVSSILFMPKLPRPARKAAWRCEKKARSFPLRDLSSRNHRGDSRLKGSLPRSEIWRYGIRSCPAGY